MTLEIPNRIRLKAIYINCDPQSICGHSKRGVALITNAR
jgi:hypothetical protein